MKKQYLFIFGIILLLVIILSVSNVSAFFTDEHTKWTSDAVLNDPGIIHDRCADKVQLVIDGNFACDQFVIFYFDNSHYGSYITTHTRKGVDDCFKYAGNDPDLWCFCAGFLLHNVQDHFAHDGTFDIQGLVPKYIAKDLSSNFIGHMTIEQSFDDQFQAQYNLKNDPVHQAEISNLMTTTLLDPNVDPATNKYLTLMTQIMGASSTGNVGLTRDQILQSTNIITNGFKGTGFYNTVYQTKLSLPISWEIYSILPAIFAGLLLFVLIYVPWLRGIKTTKWKFALWFILIMIMFLSIMLFVSFLTYTTWNDIETVIKIVPIKVSAQDITIYDNAVRAATATAIQTAQLPTGYDDNSGLSYTDKLGVQHVGSLNQSELPFYYVVLPIIVITLILLISWLLFKTFRQKAVTGILKWFNRIGFTIFYATILLICYLAFNYFFIK